MVQTATLTVRVIKSFEYRTEKSLVLHDIDLEQITVAALKDKVVHVLNTQSAWKPYRNLKPDTVKLYSKAHGAKTTNLIINLDHDEWIFDDDNETLAALGLENESEVSFFERTLYYKFKDNPVTKWDC